jgi:predicted nuclease of predicted toxin-antitoxin system
MNLLLDTCVWGGAIKVLATAGHDVLWMGETEPDPGDEEIMRKAMADLIAASSGWSTSLVASSHNTA